MHVIVQSKTLPITQSLRSFIDKQAEKLEKLGVRISQASVYLENVGKRSNDPKSTSVKYHLCLPGAKDIVVRRRAVDMYDAIVDATRRAVRQLRKTKEKRITKKRRVLV